jgi:hypothetical protein
MPDKFRMSWSGGAKANQKSGEENQVKRQKSQGKGKKSIKSAKSV